MNYTKSLAIAALAVAFGITGLATNANAIEVTTKTDALVKTDGMLKATSTLKTENTVMVGGAAMYPSKNIIENAVNSEDHTTLVAAVKAAGLVDTLSGTGPFTVFAPTNEAFAKLPKGTVDTLLKTENKAKLSNILTYHVVPMKLTAAKIAADAKANGGTATYTTVEGETVSLMENSDGGWMIMDNSKHSANITIADVFQSNGVIHVTDTVIMPK